MAEAGEPKKGTVLLIEDEPAVARLTELVLISAGYAVVQARGHVLARDLLSQTRFDLVLADTKMGARAPDLEGLSQLADAARCPVLLFSAHRFPEEQIRAAGLAGMIPKPFDIDDLLSIVEETLHGTGEQDTAGESS